MHFGDPWETPAGTKWLLRSKSSCGGGGAGVTRYVVFSSTRNTVFPKRSPEWRFFFLKRRLIVFVRTDENGGFPKRSFHTCQTAKGKGCYSISSVLSFRVAGQKRLAYATCVRVFFRKRRKNSPLSNIFGYVWPWTRRNFHSVVYRDSLLSSTLSGLFSEAPTHRAPYS